MEIRAVKTMTWSTKSSALLGIMISLMVIAAIWIPEFLLWHVKAEPPSAEMILRFRTEPTGEVLHELGEMDLKPPLPPASKSEVILMAEGLTHGVFRVPGFPDEQISPVFSPADLRKGSLKWQLVAASLAGVEQLLDAYRQTGKEEYFELARANIVAFARFESSRWLDVGFLWNDHAIAARISVLIKFWALYRQRADFNLETARVVLSLVARSGLLLAKPAHYAWRTGHGIVSNLALMQISLAFPFLKESTQFRETAQRRLTEHIPYYVNREGVTLLHSAGYSVGGVRALGMVMRLYTLSGTPIPEEWWRRLQRAEDFYALVRRPDGTLPMFGDTRSDADPFPPRTRWLEGGQAAPLVVPESLRHRGGTGLYPEAGYAVWWFPRKAGDQTALSQTVAAWSYYPGLGHKHADELSVLVWAAGRTWLTSVGYWPYGVPGRLQAESWTGSNAPHLRGESALSSRMSRVNAFATNDEQFFIDMERRGPASFRVRREVLQIEATTWIILDRYSDTEPREAEVLWMFYPDLNVVRGRGVGSFSISSPFSAKVMRCSFQVSPGGEIEHVSGKTEPFGGWVVIGEVPLAANAVRVRSSSRDGWQLTVCSLKDREEDGADDLVARVSGIDDPENWTVHVVGASGSRSLKVARYGQQIRVAEEGISAEQQLLYITKVADPGAGIAPVLAAFQASTDRSERRVSLIPYRAKVSYVLAMVLLVQELLLLALWRRRPKLALGLRMASVAAWIGGGVWLTQFYLLAG